MLAVSEQLDLLTELAHALQKRRPVEEMLQMIVEQTARLLEISHVSVRLLDPSRTRLLAIVRAGQPVHADEEVVFVRGEGLVGWIAEHEDPIRLGRADLDPRFVVKPGMRQTLGSFLGVPLVSRGDCLGVISAVHPDPDRFTEHDEKLVTLIAAICAPRVEAARLERLTGVDPLTGALNRRGLDREFPEIEVPAGEASAPLSVAMVDLDHFKQINDRHGHGVGDEVLKTVGRMLGEVVRAGDAVVRYGGEEFVLLLPQVDLEGAVGVAERARATLAADPIATEQGTAVPVTVSIGVAERRPGESRKSVMERADAAMYRAKQAGRNRVVAAD